MIVITSLTAAPRGRQGRAAAQAVQADAPGELPGPQAGAGVSAAKRLLDRLTAKQPVTVVCLGDSITDGFNVPDPNLDGFPALLRRMLEERWAGAQVTVHRKGVPGNTTNDALARFADDVSPLAPNLVVLQFGGNDKGVGDGLANLPRYQQNLRRLVANCEKIGAAALLCTPPMHEPVVDMPFPVAARRVAQDLRLPIADLDTAVKAGGYDYRGLFPYFVHPQEPGHAQMALEIYRALCSMMGIPLTSSVSIDASVRGDCKLGGFSSVQLHVANKTEAVRQATLRVDAISSFQDGPVPVPAGGETSRFLPIALPHTLSGGRSLEWPLWVSADLGGEVAFGLARITAVPVMSCPNAALQAAKVPFASLSWAHLSVGSQMGRSDWKGDRDLSANIYLACDEAALTITLDVADDIVKTDVAMPLGDGVEVYLDLRDDNQRGRPYFTKQCATLFIGAGSAEQPSTIVSPPDDETAPELLALKPVCVATARGYRLTLAIPRTVLNTVAGRPLKSLGLDLAVDDCDGTQRKQQMMWLGRGDNFVNPRRLGELRLDQMVEPGTVRVTVF
ncbi:MAG: hypothetical protein HZB16_04125 [Armatimonadetes bacterium]|nr:hypothetical protein [Armatimonadota bacterium]